MDLSKLKELIDLMNRHQLDELEIEDEASRIRLKKQGDRIKEVVSMPGVAMAAAPAPGSPPAPAAAPVDDANLIKSPMVGTFYRSPNPDAEPFVETGDQIEEGQVLCIIEAMKVMNEIKAERSGTIEEVYPESGTPVEFGERLFRIS